VIIQKEEKMDKPEMAKNLSSLMQLDIDAVHAYDQAIKNIEDPMVRDQIVKFRDDHKRHIEELSPEIRALGETPPEFSPDFKGYLISGFTSLRSITGTEGALNAMHTNEKLTNKNYDEARTWPLNPSAKALVEKNYSDERTHLEYIEKTLEARAWEK
jgi:rubrerythrin